jgi:hypothetical protein
MDRRRKVSDSDIRQIFRSAEPAPVLSKQFGISEQMVYLIRSGRAHSRITQGLHKPTATRAAADKVVIIAIADAIIDRLIARLRTADPKATGPKRSPRRRSVIVSKKLPLAKAG